MTGQTSINANWILIISVLSVNMISFSCNAGYSWTSPFLPKLNGNVDPDKNPLPKPITKVEESWITSLHSLGAFCGLFLTGLISETFGKKWSLICFSVPVFVSNILLIFANSVIYFYVSRFLLGVGTASVFSILPSYIAEITDVRNRGKAGMVMPVMSALTHFTIVSVGPYVTIRTYGFISLVPSLIFYCVFVPFVPESPYQYVLCDKLEEAKISLKTLRRKDDVENELQEIIWTTRKTKATGSIKEIITAKSVKKALFISCGLIFCQNSNGAIPVTAYQQEIFHMTESVIPNHISVIIVGVFQLFATILVLIIIDKVGRKKLFYVSFIGLFIALIVLGAYYFFYKRGYNLDSLFWIPLLCIIMHMVCFRIGAGPVSWTVIGEIFPANLKAQLGSFVTGENVILCFIASMIYPIMEKEIGLAWTFWTFGFLTIFSILFIFLVVPEIKGKTFVEIQDILIK